MNDFVSHLSREAEIIMGQSPPGDTYNTNGIGMPLLNGPSEFGTQHPIEKQWTTSPTKVCRPGDVLFCVRGATAGRINIADKEYCLGRGLAAVRPKPGTFDSSFLYHVLSAGYARFQAAGVGSTFININADMLARFEVPRFPIGEQRRLAAILDQADNLRRKRRLALQSIDGLSWAVFIKLFGDPFSGEQRWPVKTVGDVTASIRYGIGSPPQYSEEGVPFIRATNIKNGRIIANGIKYIDRDASVLISKCRVDVGNLLVVRSGVNTGECTIVSDAFDGAYAAYDLIVDCDTLTGTYLNELLNSRGGRSATARLSRRAAQAHLNSEQLATFPIPWPPLLLLEKFLAIKASLELLRALMIRSTLLADQFFASLQHHAFAGNLTSSTIEATLASV